MLFVSAILCLVAFVCVDVQGCACVSAFKRVSACVRVQGRACVSVFRGVRARVCSRACVFVRIQRDDKKEKQ